MMTTPLRLLCAVTALALALAWGVGGVQAQRRLPGLPDQPNASAGGVIPPVSPVAPPAPGAAVSQPGQFAPPGPPPRYNSPVCRMPPATRSADLAAYCATLGQ
jgi:hypothetical protein